MVSDLTVDDLTIEHQEHEQPIVRFSAYQKFGFQEKAFEDESESVRMAAYKNLGFTKNAFDDEDEDVRLAAYRVLGFTQKALVDDCRVIRRDAEQYFERCREILDIEEAKYTFTKDEAELIRFNGLPVLS